MFEDVEFYSSRFSVCLPSKMASPTHKNCDNTREEEFMLLPHPAGMMAGTAFPSSSVLTAVDVGYP